MKKLAVFDMHGTLLWALEAYEHAYTETAKELFVVNGSMHDVYFGASTIQTVTMGIAKAKGVPENVLKQKEQLILPVFEKHFEAALKRVKPRVLQGVEKLLYSLKQKDFVIALYTGDSQKTSGLLLHMAGLEKYFDRELRSCASRKKPVFDRKVLLAEVIKKTEKKHGRFPKNSVFLFDDSVKGINAGNELGIITIAVATGPDSISKLKKSKPSFLFKKFFNVEKIINAIEK